MNKTETVKILSIIKVAYPRFEIKDTETAKLTMELWQSMLENEYYPLVEVSIKKLIAESPFPPTIHDVLKRISDIKNPNILTDAEGWAEVMRAISNHGLYDIDGALESMSEFTRKVVNTMGFREICMSENIDTVRAQFRMAYNSMATRKKQDDLLPDRLKIQMAQIGNIKRLEGEK